MTFGSGPCARSVDRRGADRSSISLSQSGRS
jgi:hypothetical protein